jgi:hypothetical protein
VKFREAHNLHERALRTQTAHIYGFAVTRKFSGHLFDLSGWGIELCVRSHGFH